MNYEDANKELVNVIRQSFFDVVLDLFANYRDCMGQDAEGDTIFQIMEFMEMSDHNNTVFYKAFFQGEKTRINSQLFMNFINNARL